MFTIGYFPGKQTATPSKPKRSTSGGGGGSSSGSTSPTPYNTSPALNPELREQREAANQRRSTTGGGSSTGTTAARVELATAPETPGGASGTSASPTRAETASTGQQIVQSFKAPSSQFRTGGGAALISETSYNKAGEQVTTYYGTYEEQKARRTQARNEARQGLLQQIEQEDRKVLISGLKRQQGISRQLRSGLVQPGQVPVLKSELAQPKTKTVPGTGRGLPTTSIYGGLPLTNLGYRIMYDQRTRTDLEKEQHPIKYHAKKYKSGIIKGVGAGMLGYAASQTTLVSGAAGAVGASISVGPAALAAGVVAVGVGAYYGVKEAGAKYDTFKESGFTGVWDREKTRADEWKQTANKYSGEIVEGVAAVSFAIPTYMAATSYYSGGPVPVSMDKGKITRTGPELNPTSKQTTSRTFQVGRDKYVVKASTTAKEKILPGVRAEAIEKTKFDVFKIGASGKHSLVKTVYGQGEVQLKTSGEFIRFQKVGTTKTTMTVGQLSRGGRSTTPRFVFESTSGTIKGYTVSNDFKSFGVVERTSQNPPTPINVKPGEITQPRINEVWRVAQVTKEITPPKISDEFNKLVFKGMTGNNILVVDAVPRGGTIVLPRPEVAPVFGTIGAAAPAVKPLTIAGLSTGAGSAAALSAAVMPGLAGAVLVGGVVGGGVISSGIEKASPVSISKSGPASFSIGTPTVSTGYGSISQPRVLVEAQSTPAPAQPDIAADFSYNSRVENPVSPVVGLPGPIGALPPPEVPPGIPRSSLPPGGGVDSWARKLLKKGKQPKGYTPSATALAFSIKGKPSATGAKTGLGLRPIVEQKKKKQKFRF